MIDHSSLGEAQWALRASLLVVLESQSGRWNTLAYLAGRVVAPIWLVRELGDDLVARGEAMRRLYYGQPVYGLAIVDDYPGVNDVRDDAADPGVCIGGFEP